MNKSSIFNQSVTFAILAFVISWIIGPVIYLIAKAVLPLNLQEYGDLVIKFGPTIAAILSVILLTSSEQKSKFKKSALRLNVHFGWYFFALLVPIIMAVLVIFLNIRNIQVEIEDMASLTMKSFFLAFLLGGGLGEEFGWRGYLFPRLVSMTETWLAILGTGFIWGMWHAPMYLFGQGPLLINFGDILLITFSASIVLGWLYLTTNGSVLICAIYHGAINASATILAESSTIAGAHLIFQFIVVQILLSVLVFIFFFLPKTNKSFLQNKLHQIL